jgi:hypothetical protein
MQKIVATLATLMLTGCVAVGTGRVPVPSGQEVEAVGDYGARIDAADFSAFVWLRGFNLDLVLFGPIVPIIPYGPWKWLTGKGADEYRMTVELELSPKTPSAAFVPGSLRIVVGDRIYAPTDVHRADMEVCRTESIDHSKWRRSEPVREIHQALPIKEAICFWFYFDTLPPPGEAFRLTADGLPTVDYKLERRFGAGALKQ